MPQDDTLPLQRRAMPISTVDATARTAEVVWTTGAGVERYDYRRDEPYLEVLEVSPSAIDLTRLNNGAPLLNSHMNYALETVLGVVERAWIEGGEGKAILRFPTAGLSEEADRVFALVSEGIIRNISCGYRILEASREVRADGAVTWRVTRWEPHELSLVAIGADAKASVRGEAETATYAFTLTNQRALPEHQETRMEPETTLETPAAPVVAQAAPVQDDQRSQAAPAPQKQVLTARDAADVVQRAALMNIPADVALGIAAQARTMAEATESLISHLAQESENQPKQRAATRVMRDEGETLMQRLLGALEYNLAPSSNTTPPESIREFVDHSLIEMAALRLNERRVPNAIGARMDILHRAFHTTSDFPILFEGALNSTLAARYATAAPTYRAIARQRSYTDFRVHNSIRPGDFPSLQPVSPAGGEIKSGTFSESKEATSVKTFGVRVNFSLEMLVNDRLNAIQQVLNDQANSVARFEDDEFYRMVFSGPNNHGPTLLETSRQVFNTTDKTLAAAGSAIDITALSTARAELRKRKSKDNVVLNIVPRILLVGADKETQAQQLLSPIQAQQAGNVNPFPNTLDIVVSPAIDGSTWFLFADPSVAPVFEWGLLDGRTAPLFRIEEPFGVLGTSMSLQHHFGCGAIDFRGAWKNPGA